MQLFQSDDHYILHDGEYSLWCCRHSGTLEAKKGFVIHYNNSITIYTFSLFSYGQYMNVFLIPSSKGSYYLVSCEMSEYTFSEIRWIE